VYKCTGRPAGLATCEGVSGLGRALMSMQGVCDNFEACDTHLHEGIVVPCWCCVGSVMWLCSCADGTVQMGCLHSRLSAQTRTEYCLRSGNKPESVNPCLLEEHSGKVLCCKLEPTAFIFLLK